MPFDEHDPPENEPKHEDNKPKRPGPILHNPKSGPNVSVKIVIPIVLLLAAGIGGYWYYKNKNKPAIPPPAVVTIPSTDTAKIEPPAVQPPVETTAIKPSKHSTKETKKREMKKETAAAPKTKGKARHESVKERHVTEPVGTSEVAAPKLTSSGTGKFTIFVGSFKDKTNADNVFQRWKDAGYPVYMSTKGPWHRVSLGKYASKEAAQSEAKKMRDAFENGYFVDVLP